MRTTLPAPGCSGPYFPAASLSSPALARAQADWHIEDGDSIQFGRFVSWMLGLRGGGLDFPAKGKWGWRPGLLRPGVGGAARPEFLSVSWRSFCLWEEGTINPGGKVGQESLAGVSLTKPLKSTTLKVFCNLVATPLPLG